MNATLTFGNLVKDFKLAGFPARDLLPLIPPGATLSPGSKVSPKQIGKIPGRYLSDGTWVGLQGWTGFGVAETDQPRMAGWPTQNVGLRSADFPGIDCDTNTPEALAMVERVIVRNFGTNNPVRARANAPRALYVLRRDENELPIGKHKIMWTDTDGVEQAVEVLGAGQQYVISGVHTSGIAYEWRGPSLTSFKVEGLTRVTVEKVRDFMAQLEEEIVLQGGTVTSKSAAKYGRGDGGVETNHAEPIVDPKLALEALRSIPNTVDTLPTRESLVGLLSSFKQAVGREADSLYYDVVTWAGEHGWATEDYVARIWDSLTSSRVHPDHLLHMARKYGWRGDAVLDFAKVDEGEMTVNEKIAHAKQHEAKMADNLSAVAAELAYCPADGYFVHIPRGAIYTPDRLNKAPFVQKIAVAGTAGKKAPANRLLHTPGLVKEIDGMTYWPGENEIVTFERNGRMGPHYNTWHSAPVSLPPKATDADIKPWLDHLALLVPDKDARNVVVDFLAHIVQRRGVKIRYGLLMVGGQGIGKDTLLTPLTNFFQHNCQEVKPEQLMGKWTGYHENELLIVQEMKRDRRFNNAYNNIKILLAGTARDMLPVEKKFQNEYFVPNVINTVFFSNHEDCIELEPDDRRLYVVVSNAEKPSSAYFDRLIDDFYKDKSGWLYVIRWLMDRDLSRFNPNVIPADTSGKLEMIEAARPDLYTALDVLFNTTWKNRTAVTVAEVLRAVREDPTVPLDFSKRKDAEKNDVMREMRALKWSSPGVLVEIRGTKGLRYWVRPGTNPTREDFKQQWTGDRPNEFEDAA